MEWSEGWGADPKVVAGMVANNNALLKRLDQPTYDKPITDTKSVMATSTRSTTPTSSCVGRTHIGHPAQNSLDRRGHQAVGIHNAVLPVLLYQLFCDWEHWDMFAGTTGTTGALAVAPHPKQPGGAVVLHVDAAEPNRKLVQAGIDGKQIFLPPDHPACKAAHRTAKYTTAQHAG